MAHCTQTPASLPVPLPACAEPNLPLRQQGRESRGEAPGLQPAASGICSGTHLTLLADCPHHLCRCLTDGKPRHFSAQQYQLLAHFSEVSCAADTHCSRGDGSLGPEFWLTAWLPGSDRS